MHRKCELVTQELSGGSRSGVEGEQKLCKPHTERERGPPDTLADAKSVCLSTPSSVQPHLWFVLSDNVSLHLFVRPKTIFNLSSIYTKKARSLFGPFTQHIVYDTGLFRRVSGEGGGGLSKHLQLKQHKQHLKAFTAPALSSLSFCGFIGSKEGCSCVIVRKSFITTATHTHTHTNVCTHAYTQRHDDSSA